jgi:hypothetical protein
LFSPIRFTISKAEAPKDEWMEPVAKMSAKSSAKSKVAAIQNHGNFNSSISSIQIR